MAEKKFQISNNGTAVLQSDFNLLGESAGLADDRVFAELFRMPPMAGSTVSKGILPSGTYAKPLIATAGATGGVNVAPFRAFVGSRVLEATEAKLNYRDIRSGLSVVEGSTAATKFVALATNASGNPRWDAVYAIVTIDTDSASTIRKVKSPTTGVVADTSVAVTKETLVTISSLAGTPAASPEFPALPTDTADTFYVILGYVRVANGHTAGTTVAKTDIATTANCLKVSSSTGSTVSGFATSNTEVTTLQQQSWGPLGGRPDKVIAATATGGETLWVCLDMNDAIIGAHSHADGDVVDSRDWRGRLCSFNVSVDSSTFEPAWSRSISGGGAANTAPSGEGIAYPTANATAASGIGQSINANFGAVVANAARIAQVDAGGFASIQNAAIVTLYVDMTTGALKLYKSDNPRTVVIFKLDWSAPIENVR